MKSIYWTYRPERISAPYNLDWWVSLNWTYTASFFLNNQFWDWYTAWLTNIKDQIIPEDKYIWLVAPWVPKLTRFIMCEYNEQYVDSIELARSIENTWARFNIDMISDIEVMRQRIRDNTSLKEINPWKFEVSPESVGINWEIIPAVYITIE